MEGLLEEKKKVKEEKLRKLTFILEDLKKEKAEMKKYEKPGSGGGKWSSKTHTAKNYLESTPNRPSEPDRSASLVRTVEPRKSGSSRKKKPSSATPRAGISGMPPLLPPPPAHHRLYIGR